MKAIIVKGAGGAEQLVLSEEQLPKPRAGELLLRVKAAGVNRTDIIHRERGMGSAGTTIPGVEAAGIVKAVGAGVRMKRGTKVMGIVNGAAYAEYCILREDRAMVMPQSLSFEEAAAIPEVFLTAYQTLFSLGRLDAGETVLIHAGGSGVGTAAIQLAKIVGQARVFTTAGTAGKLAYCRSLGADLVVNYKETDFSEAVLAATNGKGVDLILDFVGASYWAMNYRAIRIDGRWVLIGTLGGSQIDSFDLGGLMTKRIQLTGTLLTPRSAPYKAQLTRDFSEHCLPLFDQGDLKAIVDSVYPLKDAAAAHLHMEANKNIGKIILSLT